MPMEAHLTEAVVRISVPDIYDHAVSAEPDKRLEQFDEMERLLRFCEVQVIRSGVPLPLGAIATIFPRCPGATVKDRLTGVAAE
jgi:hypothetical protein